MSTIALPTLPADAPEPASGADESELVRRLRSGCAEAFAEVVRRQTRPLLAVARRILGNEEDACDAVQETFAAAFRGIASFAEEARLSTWLHRIAVNVSLMQLRRRRRRPEESMPDAPVRAEGEGAWLAGGTLGPGSLDEEIERCRLRAKVRRCIARLPETHRNILWLRDLEDRSTDEAAAMLGISANAAKIRLHRARHALRAILEDEPYAPAEGTEEPGSGRLPRSALG